MPCNDSNAGMHGIEYLAVWEVVSNATFCIQLCNDVVAIQESNGTTTYILIDGDADEGESTDLYDKSVSWKDGGHQLLQWIK